MFINDGSKDHTLDIMRELHEEDSRVSYVDLSRNFGKEIAMIAGIDYLTGDAAIIMDADLQDPPELIPEMISWWEKGYQDVSAKRRSRAGESFFKKWSSHAFYTILQKMSSVPMQRDVGDFRLLDKQCLNALRLMRESQRYTKGLFSWIGFEKKEVLFDRDARAAGKTKWNYWKLLNLAIEGITSFTIAPLRASAFVGCILAFFASCICSLSFFAPSSVEKMCLAIRLSSLSSFSSAVSNFSFSALSGNTWGASLMKVNLGLFIW